MATKGRWFCTRYPSGAATYGTTLFAKDERDAERLMRKRGLGEQPDMNGGWSKRADFTRPSVLFWGNAKPLEVLHALTFLCQIAATSGVIDVREALTDAGILHEVQHYYLFGKSEAIRVNGRLYKNTVPRRVLYERIRDLERAVPGYTDGD